MLNLKVKEKKSRSQEKRYVVSLAFNWAGKAKSKDAAESKAREIFKQKMKHNIKHYWLYHSFLFNWLDKLSTSLSNWLWKKRWKTFRPDIKEKL